MPTIEECGLCPQELRNSCQESEHVRKGVLKQCRRLVVRQKLAERDRLDQSEAVCKLLPALGVSFRDLQPCPTTVVFKDYDVDLDGSSRVWRWFRIWSLISISGLWPLCVFGTPDMPLQFESCSLCGTQSIEVHHVVTCPGTQDFFNSFRCDMLFFCRKIKHRHDPVLQDHCNKGCGPSDYVHLAG